MTQATIIKKIDSGREVVDVAVEAAICPKEEQADVTTSNLVVREQKISTSINYLSLILLLLILFILLLLLLLLLFHYYHNGNNNHNNRILHYMLLSFLL